MSQRHLNVSISEVPPSYLPFPSVPTHSCSCSINKLLSNCPIPSDSSLSFRNSSSSLSSVNSIPMHAFGSSSPSLAPLAYSSLCHFSLGLLHWPSNRRPPPSWIQTHLFQSITLLLPREHGVCHPSA